MLVQSIESSYTMLDPVRAREKPVMTERVIDSDLERSL